MIRKFAQSPPDTPGVYTFRKGTKPLYIGKAANLKKRLASYFRKNAGGKAAQLLAEATALEWIETLSEAEALIKEAELIKSHRPKFNYLMRDDKSYFYVGFTRETYPRVAVLHKTALNPLNGKYRRAIGPFTVGSELWRVLKLLRRLFPYCTCKELHKRPCLNSQIGRCPRYCCAKNQESGIRNQEEYKKNLYNIAAVLSGRRTRLISQLKREMRAASKIQEYERAARIRDQIAGLEHIFSHRPLIEVRLQSRGGNPGWRRTESAIRGLLDVNTFISRVEGYDISNISGTSATGSMVVFIDGKPAKSEYRKFKIKTVHQANDIAMHKEVLRRRLAHTEWPYPQLILIDGGRAQRNAAAAALRESGIRNQGAGSIKIAALAKREEELYIEGKSAPVRLDSFPSDAMHFFQRVRDESHRFAKKYHHKLREMSYRGSYKSE